MKKIIALLLISFGLQSQTLLKFKQIEQSGATGSLVITTGTNGVLTYTPQIPYSKITGTPSLSGYIPYTGANSFTTSNNITAASFISTGQSTLNTLYVPSTATVNGALLANSTSTFLNNTKTNGVINIYDGGTQTINGGLVSQVNGAVLTLGANTGSANLFGGAYDVTQLGGAFQIDTRSSSSNLFIWASRGANVTASGTGTNVMTLTNSGVLTLLPQASSHLSVKNSASGFMTDFYDNSTHKSMEFYGDNSAHGSIIRMYNTGTTNNVQLVGSGASGQNNFFLTAKTGFGTSAPTTTIHSLGNSMFTNTTTTFGSSLLHQMRICQGTGTVDIGQFTAGYGTIWAGVNTPAATNYAMASNGTNLVLNAPVSNIFMSVANGANLVNVNANTNYFTKPTRIGSTTAPTATLDVTGTMSVSSTFSAAGRVEQAQGASVASANNLALGADGNSFEITGTKQINLITNTNWQNGSIIRLLFTSTPVVKNGQATSGANITIKLAGGVDFSATADDILTLELCTIGDTVAWREVSRSVN